MSSLRTPFFTCRIRMRSSERLGIHVVAKAALRLQTDLRSPLLSATPAYRIRGADPPDWPVVAACTRGEHSIVRFVTVLQSQVPRTAAHATLT